MSEVSIGVPATSAREVRTGSLGGWPLGWRSVGLWFAAYAALTAVWAAAGRLLVAASGPVPREVAVNRWFEARRTPGLDNLTSWLSRTADVGPKLALIALFGLLFVVLWRRLDEAVFLVALMSLEVTSFVTTTALVSRARPDVVRLDASPPTSSFPSGHVAATTALYLGVATVVWWHSQRRRWPAVVVTLLAVLGVVAVALARLYRGMHYLTDVGAGTLLGLAAIALGYAVLAAGRTARDQRQLPDRPDHLPDHLHPDDHHPGHHPDHVAVES